jgi:hypothetical protein
MSGGCTSIVQEAAKGADPALHGSGSLGASEGPGITDLKSLRLEREGQDASALHSQPPPDGSLEPQPENTLPSGPDSTKPSRSTQRDGSDVIIAVWARSCDPAKQNRRPKGHMVNGPLAASPNRQ